MQTYPHLRMAFSVLVVLALSGSNLLAQTGFKINLPRPREYQERVLRSERTPGGKLKGVSKWIQNTVTHYNFAFNAAQKLNSVIDRAKASHRDDYSKLISFYNYSRGSVLQDSIHLDTVIQKASSGIALHDLRNEWVDNLYLLWGAAFYYQQKFDSAHQLFQFINVAFAPRDRDGSFRVIGSRQDGNRSNSIASDEKRGLFKKMLSSPPSRNDALIWQIRNHLAQDQYSEAATLIEVLRKDPAFPERLQPALAEVTSLQFYQLEKWDSAAHYLSLALPEASNQQERARWEYLIAQLYEKADKRSDAYAFYKKVIPRTTDLILEIYARLGSLRTHTQKQMVDINKNVSELLLMAQRDKYLEYRDIIYYMAAQMDLTGGNTERAMRSLLSSTEAASNNPAQRNKAFLELADLSYTAGQYKAAARFYDSIDVKDGSLTGVMVLEDRKKALQRLVRNIDVLQRQDSLWKIVALPEEQRKEWVRQQLKEIKKQQGLPEDPAFAPRGNNPLSPIATATLFSPGDTKGEWYFYNASSRSRGQLEFKSRWGNRPNSDNWRRLAALQAMMNNMGGGLLDSATPSATASYSAIDFETLYRQLPLTESQQRLSLDSISQALFGAGKILIVDMEDCARGIPLLERLLKTDSTWSEKKEVYLHLYRCYQKSGDSLQTKRLKQLLEREYPDDPATVSLLYPPPQNSNRPSQADSIYQQIYSLFTAGEYEAAIKGKKMADSVFGAGYWTPQLLYIESIYYIRQRQDTTAIAILRQLQTQFPGHPLESRASRLIDLLLNRAQTEASQKVAANTGQASGAPDPIPEYWNDETGPFLAVLALSQVEPALITPIQAALDRFNRQQFAADSLRHSAQVLSDKINTIQVSQFLSAKKAADYIEKVKRVTGSEIASGLQKEQAQWLFISVSNWQVLLQKKEVESYKSFINKKRH